MPPPSPANCCTTFSFSNRVLILVIGNPGDVTHTKPSPKARFPSALVKPRSMVAITLLVFGSIRATLPSLRESTQIEFSVGVAPPKASETGSDVTSIRAVTTLVCGLIRMTRFSPGQTAQIELSANEMDRQLAGSRISETTELVSGSIRVSVVLSSVSAQMLSGLETIPRGAVPEPASIAAIDFPVAVSKRATPLEPQVTTHRFRKAFARPPQGLAIPEKGSSVLFVRPSTRTI